MILKIWTVFLARTREFYRDVGGLIWNLGFPLLIILGFAFAFSRSDQAQYKVGVFPAAALKDTIQAFLHVQYVQFVPYDSLDLALAKVGRHQLDMLLRLDPSPRYYLNKESSKGYLVEKVLEGSLPVGSAKEYVTGKRIRYVDWVVPGVLCMNMMFSGLFGVGWMIVRYRRNGYLKRLKATPLKAHEFLIGQLLSRLVVIVGTGALVFALARLLLGIPMNGSYLLLLATYVIGTFCIISLGLVFASRLSNEELVSGLLNFATWPMMLLSGIWFSLEGLNPMVQRVAQVFPLTHVVNAARAIMIDGAGLSQIAFPLTVLATLSVVFLAVGSLLFRWDA